MAALFAWEPILRRQSERFTTAVHLGRCSTEDERQMNGHLSINSVWVCENTLNRFEPASKQRTEPWISSLGASPSSAF